MNILENFLWQWCFWQSLAEHTSANSFSNRLTAFLQKRGYNQVEIISLYWILCWQKTKVCTYHHHSYCPWSHYLNFCIKYLFLTCFIYIYIYIYIFINSFIKSFNYLIHCLVISIYTISPSYDICVWRKYSLKKRTIPSQHLLDQSQYWKHKNNA